MSGWQSANAFYSLAFSKKFASNEDGSLNKFIFANRFMSKSKRFMHEMNAIKANMLCAIHVEQHSSDFVHRRNAVFRIRWLAMIKSKCVKPTTKLMWSTHASNVSIGNG